jgi:hypothetical protein
VVAAVLVLTLTRADRFAVFVKDSTADEATRERTIAAAARLAFDAWTAK